MRGVFASALYIVCAPVCFIGAVGFRALSAVLTECNQTRTGADSGSIHGPDRGRTEEASREASPRGVGKSSPSGRASPRDSALLLLIFP